MLVFSLAFGYMFINMGSVLHLGKSLYPFVNSNGFAGIVLVPSGVFLLTLLSLLLFEKLTYNKLAMLGYGDFVDAIKNSNSHSNDEDS